MAVTKSVFVQNLGPEFEIGTKISNKITIATAAPLSTVGGKLTIAPADLAAMLATTTTNTLSLAGAVLTNTTNGVAATQDITAAVKAAETLTKLSYVQATGVLTYVDEKGVSTAIDLPTESIFTNVAYDAASQKLTFTLVSGATSSVDLASLVDTTVINAGNGIAVAGNGSTATPFVVSVKADPAPGNLATVTAAGVMVSPAALASATTHTLANPTNTITSVVNGVSATAPAVNTVVMAAGAAAGTVKTTVNGVASNELNIGAVVRPLADVEVQDAFGTTMYYAFSTNV